MKRFLLAALPLVFLSLPSSALAHPGHSGGRPHWHGDMYYDERASADYYPPLRNEAPPSAGAIPESSRVHQPEGYYYGGHRTYYGGYRSYYGGHPGWADGQVRLRGPHGGGVTITPWSAGVRSPWGSVHIPFHIH